MNAVAREIILLGTGQHDLLLVDYVYTNEVIVECHNDMAITVTRGRLKGMSIYYFCNEDGIPRDYLK